MFLTISIVSATLWVVTMGLIARSDCFKLRTAFDYLILLPITPLVVLAGVLWAVAQIIARELAPAVFEVVWELWLERWFEPFADWSRRRRWEREWRANRDALRDQSP